MVSSRVRGSSKQMRLSDLYKTGRKKTKQTKTKKVLVESEKPAAKVPVVDDGNDSHCGACSADGDLVCCDGCPAAFHAKCVGLDPDNLPEGDWFCDKCAAKDDAEAKPAEVAAAADGEVPRASQRRDAPFPVAAARRRGRGAAFLSMRGRSHSADLP